MRAGGKDMGSVGLFGLSLLSAAADPDNFSAGELLQQRVVQHAG